MLFADFINWAMDQAGLTNYKLAKRLGISQTTVANWANGTTEPRERRRAEVLALFGVDETDLEVGFPEIHYSEEKGKPTPISESELSNDKTELIRLFDLASPELQAAALAVLKSAEAADNIPGVHSTK